MYKPTPHFLGFILAIALIAFAGGAFAADANVSWVNATKNVDGTDIPTDTSSSALRDTRIRYGTCNSAKTQVVTVTATVTVPMPATTRTITGLAEQEYCFQARHSNRGDQYSDWSAAVARNFTPPIRKPGPPTGISVASLQEDLIVSARWAAEAFAPIHFGG